MTGRGAAIRAGASGAGGVIVPGSDQAAEQDI
jgi:hypothetical protein